LADNAAYQVEKAVKEAGDKISADQKSSVEAKVQDLRQAMNGDDVSRIKSLTEELQQEYAKVMAANPQTQQTSGDAEPQAGENPKPDGDVIEGEFTEQ
jgi:molecular chaperone DnaK